MSHLSHSLKSSNSLIMLTGVVLILPHERGRATAVSIGSNNLIKLTSVVLILPHECERTAAVSIGIILIQNIFLKCLLRKTPYSSQQLRGIFISFLEGQD